jgi:hypothetical protein
MHDLPLGSALLSLESRGVLHRGRAVVAAVSSMGEADPV